MRLKTSVTAILLIVVLGLLAAGAVLYFPSSSPPQDANGKVKRKAQTGTGAYQTLLHAGDEAKHRGDLTVALESYQKASELEPRQAVLYERIGEVFLIQRNYDGALKNAELVRSLDPSNTSIVIQTVRAKLGLRKILDAASVLEQIKPDTQASLYYRGLIAAFLNEQEAAKKLLSESIATEGNPSLKEYAKNVLLALEIFEVARDSRIEYLQVMLAESFDQIGEYGMAIELAFNALKTQHDYRDAWTVLGHAFLNEGKWLDAEDALTKATALDATQAAPFLFRGIALGKLQKSDDALRDFKQAVALNFQPRLQGKKFLADAHFERKEFSEAFLQYREIAMSDPAEIDRFIRPMALAINHLKKPEEALALAKKAYEAHPDTAMGHNLLGWAALALDDVTAAHQHLEEAVRRDPELAAAYLNLGQLAEREERFDDALVYYQKAEEFALKTNNTGIKETAHLRSTTIQESGTTTVPTAPIAPAPAAVTAPTPGTPKPALSLPEAKKPFIPSLSLE